MTDINEILHKHPGFNRDTLIPILQEIQDEQGFLSEEAVREIGKYLNLPTSKIYGLATFYNQFRFTPIGKYHIRICDGTSCHLESSGLLVTEIEKLLDIRDGETTRNGLFSLEVLSCIGACGQAPVVSVNGRYYEKVDKNKLIEIIDHYRENEEK